MEIKREGEREGERVSGKCEVLPLEGVLLDLALSRKQMISLLVCLKLSQVPVEPDRAAVFHPEANHS